ncbi:Glutathione-specific gamma-glutamylcyclotransferase-like protein [Elsinoe fawcettii]|nr:Glutathione-specific gamma-glutamylcyclotransferase-like protein [Elsinoe fawcettii]
MVLMTMSDVHAAMSDLPIKTCVCLATLKATEDHRGTPEDPGRVVTLLDRKFWETLTDHHADAPPLTWGAAYRIPAPKVKEVREYLDIREINGYSMQYVPFTPAPSFKSDEDLDAPIPCLVYIGLPDNPQFVGPQDPQTLAEHIVTHRGPSGLNKDYLYELDTALLELSTERAHPNLKSRPVGQAAAAAAVLPAVLAPEPPKVKAVRFNLEPQVKLIPNRLDLCPPPIYAAATRRSKLPSAPVSSKVRQPQTVTATSPKKPQAPQFAHGCKVVKKQDSGRAPIPWRRPLSLCPPVAPVRSAPLLPPTLTGSLATSPPKRSEGSKLPRMPASWGSPSPKVSGSSTIAPRRYYQSAALARAGLVTRPTAVATDSTVTTSSLVVDPSISGMSAPRSAIPPAPTTTPLVVNPVVAPATTTPPVGRPVIPSATTASLVVNSVAPLTTTTPPVVQPVIPSATTTSLVVTPPLLDRAALRESIGLPALPSRLSSIASSIANWSDLSSGSDHTPVWFGPPPRAILPISLTGMHDEFPNWPSASSTFVTAVSHMTSGSWPSSLLHGTGLDLQASALSSGPWPSSLLHGTSLDFQTSSATSSGSWPSSILHGNSLDLQASFASSAGSNDWSSFSYVVPSRPVPPTYSRYRDPRTGVWITRNR